MKIIKGFSTLTLNYWCNQSSIAIRDAVTRYSLIIVGSQQLIPSSAAIK
jgi:hypothetical protein